MSFSGQVVSLNEALDGSVYSPFSGSSGTAAVSITADDGNGGTDIKVIDLNIIQIPDGDYYTLYSTELPVNFENDTRYELGTEFRALTNGCRTVYMELFTGHSGMETI